MSVNGFEQEDFKVEGQFEGATEISVETPEVEVVAAGAKKITIAVLEAVIEAGFEVTEEFKAEYADKTASTSEFCRIVFAELNINRREISDKFDINYRTVYGACANMTNSAPDSHKGRTSVEATIDITPAGQVYTFKDGVGCLDGVVSEESINLMDCTKKNRKEFIQEKVAEGMTNADIAKLLLVSHGVVYNATKDMEGNVSNKEVIITLEDGTTVKRAEHIRKLFAEGMSRTDIKTSLNCEYNVVYAATKTEKSDAEKLADAVAIVAKYGAKVVDVESFTSAIAILGLAVMAENSGTTEAEAEVEEDAVDAE